MAVSMEPTDFNWDQLVKGKSKDPICAIQGSHYNLGPFDIWADRKWHSPGSIEKENQNASMRVLSLDLLHGGWSNLFLISMRVAFLGSVSISSLFLFIFVYCFFVGWGDTAPSSAPYWRPSKSLPQKNRRAFGQGDEAETISCHRCDR